MSDSLWSYGLPTILLRPWDFPGKNTGVGCHFLLQRIFTTQGSNWVSHIAGRCFTVWAMSKMNERIERDTCTPLFITALFTIARTWKQPRCPLADERIRKLWYIYTVEYYSAIKKNTFESVLMRWMKLEPIIQSEVSQKEKHQYSILTHIYGI